MKLNKYLLFSIIPLIGISSCSRSNVNSLEPTINNSDSSKVIKSLTKELKALTKEVKNLKLNAKNPSKTLDSDSAKNNMYCADNLNSSVTRISKGILPEGYSDLDDYQLTSDFRRPGKKFPFSEALTYNDPVTGESVAVRDQNFVPGGSKVSSVWARDSIRLGGYWVFSHTVGFTTFNKDGIHKFKLFKEEKTLKDIKILDGGSNYQNRQLFVKPTGINTSNNTINFVNHGFSTGDKIVYSNNVGLGSTQPQQITGLSTYTGITTT